jgi:hypothetical protein
LDAGTALFSYSVGKDRLVLFVIRPVQESPSLSVFTIPVGEEALRTKIEEFRRLILERQTINDATFVSAARRLYELLIKPAESRRRFEEFRQAHAVRSRLPGELWATAAKLARRDGNCACRKSHFSRDGDRTQLPKAIRAEIIRGHCGFGGQ